MKALVAALPFVLCSGCVGFETYGDIQPRREPPYVSLNCPSAGTAFANKICPPITKAEVLAHLGKPTRTEGTSGAKERWVYETDNRWKGAVIYLVILPIPLMLPIGSSFRAIEYSGDSAVATEIKNVGLTYRALCGLVPSLGGPYFGCKVDSTER